MPHSSNCRPRSRLDPGERVLLADCDQHVVAFDELVGLAGRNQLAAARGVALRLDLLEPHARDPAVVVRHRLGHQVVQDGDALVLRILLFPRRRLHLVEARAHDHLDVVAAESPRRAAAVHRRIAAAQDDHALADRVGVAEGDARRASRYRRARARPPRPRRARRACGPAAHPSRRRRRRSPPPSSWRMRSTARWRNSMPPSAMM